MCQTEMCPDSIWNGVSTPCILLQSLFVKPAVSYNKNISHNNFLRNYKLAYFIRFWDISTTFKIIFIYERRLRP